MAFPCGSALTYRRGQRRLTSRSRSEQCRTRQERVRCSGFQATNHPSRRPGVAMPDEYSIDGICPRGYCHAAAGRGHRRIRELYLGLAETDREAVNAAVDTLEERGPGLGRPLVGEIAGSRNGQLKELRIGSIRILFRFDPRRLAILTDRW